MTIPFLDLQQIHAQIRGEIDRAIARVVDSGKFVLGAEVGAFEDAFARYCEAKHCVGVGNGLEALHLILCALEVGTGDEVIVSSNTYIANWLAVNMVGATPVPVEPDPRTYNLDPSRVEAAITGRTKVLMPTHLYGQPVDLDPLLEIVQRHGIKLVEDAAQAHGARYRGRRIGAHGDAVAWSFYPGKNLGALGDGGAVTTNDPALAERIRVFGNYGSHIKYVNDVRGYNSRLDPIHAAVLGVKLHHLDEWNACRQRLASRYLARMSNSGVILPIVPDWAEPVWHLFVIRSRRRDDLAQYLAERGIETLIHYPIPPHLQRAYADTHIQRESLPVAEQLAAEILSLPIGPHLTTENIDQVVDAVDSFAARDDASGAILL